MNKKLCLLLMIPIIFFFLGYYYNEIQFQKNLLQIISRKMLDGDVKKEMCAFHISLLEEELIGLTVEEVYQKLDGIYPYQLFGKGTRKYRALKSHILSEEWDYFDIKNKEAYFWFNPRDDVDLDLFLTFENRRLKRASYFKPI